MCEKRSFFIRKFTKHYLLYHEHKVAMNSRNVYSRERNSTNIKYCIMGQNEVKSDHSKHKRINVI